MQFSQVNKKLLELAKQAHDADKNLQQNENSDLLLKFFQHSSKPFEILSQTDWISAKPNRTGSASLTSGTLLPEFLSIDAKADIQIPESFLPYVDLFPVIKVPPGSQLETFKSVKVSYNSFQDWVRLSDDSGVVYYGPVGRVSKGAYPPVFSLAELTTYFIPSGNTKKTWHIQVTFNTFGILERYTGYLLGLGAQEYLGGGCSPAVATNSNNCVINIISGYPVTFPGGNVTDGTFGHSITNVSTSSVTGFGSKIEYRSVPDPAHVGQCLDTESGTNPTAVTFDLFPASGIITGFIWGKYEVWNGSQWIQQGQVGNKSWFYDNFNSHTTATINELTFAGYIPFWGSGHNGVLGVATSFPDVIDNQYRLSSPPLNAFTAPDIDHAPHIERNPDPMTLVPVERDNFYTRAGQAWGLAGGGFNQTIGNYSHSEKVFFLKSQPKSDSFANYHLCFRTGAMILSPAKYSVAAGQAAGSVFNCNPAIKFPAASKGQIYTINDPINFRAGTLLGNDGGQYHVTQGEVIFCIADSEEGNPDNWVKSYIMTQNDFFDFTGSNTYNIQTPPTLHGKIEPFYVSENADVQYKIYIVVKNPFFSQEVRHYDTFQ